jgi:hypothetical protein
VKKDDLENYYQNSRTREKSWKKELGDDLNWNLSFDNVPERIRTKHVHRLHQYKGKFIPQLVEYFLDDHVDTFKKKVFFHPGDIILDPFVGSGTTLVQANELGMHSIGIDVSEFNCLISRCKLQKYDIPKLKNAINFLIKKLKTRQYVPLFQDNSTYSGVPQKSAQNKILSFVEELQNKAKEFNYRHFPNKGFATNNEYVSEKERAFLEIYKDLLDKYNIQPYTNQEENFIDKWFMDNVKEEMFFLKDLIERGRSEEIKNILKIILSKTIRSCRATTHSDLAHLKKPQIKPYYCRKHKKICIPIYTLTKKFERYSKDVVKRIEQFDKKRKDAMFEVICGDSQTTNIIDHIRNASFRDLVTKKKIDGVFTSPPYVGQIDYHQQHAYAYDLFAFPRKDKKEIGPLFRGKSKKAREMYVKGITQVLVNIEPFLKKDYDIFLVANDKFGLYPRITEKAGMQIVESFKRPVLNRTSRDRNPYAEIIFHIKSK